MFFFAIGIKSKPEPEAIFRIWIVSFDELPMKLRRVSDILFTLSMTALANSSDKKNWSKCFPILLFEMGYLSYKYWSIVKPPGYPNGFVSARLAIIDSVKKWWICPRNVFWSDLTNFSGKSVVTEWSLWRICISDSWNSINVDFENGVFW